MKRKASISSTLIILALALALPLGQAQAGMITSERVIGDIATEREQIATFLQREDVEKKIIAWGVSPQEASKRVASLSDAEVKQIAGHIDELKAGGDGVYIGLGTLILLVILVILITKL